MSSPEDIATGPGAAPAWRAIAARVAAGDCTWQDVRDGRLCGDADFLAALDATVAECRAAEPEGSGHTGWRTSRDDDESDDEFLEPI